MSAMIDIISAHLEILLLSMVFPLSFDNSLFLSYQVQELGVIEMCQLIHPTEFSDRDRVRILHAAVKCGR